VRHRQKHGTRDVRRRRRNRHHVYVVMCVRVWRRGSSISHKPNTICVPCDRNPVCTGNEHISGYSPTGVQPTCLQHPLEGEREGGHLQIVQNSAIGRKREREMLILVGAAMVVGHGQMNHPPSTRQGIANKTWPGALSGEVSHRCFSQRMETRITAYTLCPLYDPVIA
jgi:hypothetical protein